MYLLFRRGYHYTAEALVKNFIYVSSAPSSHRRARQASDCRGVLQFYRHYAKLVSFPLAQTGEGIDACELVAWAVKAGDLVSPFDKLCDVQSDKAAIEITSRYGGRVVSLHHAVGAVVKVGAPLVDIEVSDDEQVAPEHLAPEPPGTGATSGGVAATAAAAPTPTPTPQARTGPEPTATPMPAAAAPPSGSGVRLSGGSGTAPQPPTASTSTSAPLTASPSVAAPAQGGGTSGSGVATAAAPGVSLAAVQGRPVAAQGSAQSSPVQVHASPAVRAMARELGIDLAAVPGSGPGSRVTKADVLSYKESLAQAGPVAADEAVPVPPSGSAAGTHHPDGLAAAMAAAAVAGEDATGAPTAATAAKAAGGSLTEVMAHYQRLTAAAAAAAAGVPAAAGAGAAAVGSNVLPLRGYRRAMVKSMTAAAAVPVFHFHDEVVCDRLLAVREALKGDPGLQAQGVRLTVLPLLLKALSVALQQHPHINASLAPSGADLLVHPHHNIGVAMATPSGLVVPNIKQVQRKSVAQVAVELALLQRLAAAGRVPPEALAGGTISVSNIGTIGGTYATPLVTPPEVAIVALGRLQLLPRFSPSRGSAAAAAAAAAHGPVPVSIMPISWGADHRVVDGASLAAFSNTWKALLEQPERLLLATA